VGYVRQLRDLRRRFTGIGTLYFREEFNAAVRVLRTEECVGTRPHWEGTYPQFLLGPEITEEVEPLAPGDTDECRVERWENWEKMKLRLVFDRELGEPRHDDDGRDKIRREFRRQLDIVGVSPRMAQNWVKASGERCTNVLSELSLHIVTASETATIPERPHGSTFG
jgi:hypothetical protein